MEHKLQRHPHLYPIQSLESDRAGYAGIYIHVPFCLKKCPYCDFYSVTDLSLSEPFLDALETEIRLTSTHQPPCDTIYLGGGTPSVLDPCQIGRILESCHKYFNVGVDSEVTIEINPGTVDQPALKEYKAAGINRLSIGVQSFQNQGLRFLNRIHSSKAAHKATKDARRAGVENISLDLIYGIPDTTPAYWKRDLESAIQFQPEHLSCYLLSYEPGTPLFNNLKAGLVRSVSENESCACFEATWSALESAGFLQYEVSNFARTPSFYSKHNKKYWTFMPYIGLGPGAHSFSNNRRRWNKTSVIEYVRSLNDNQLATDKEEILTTEQQVIEALYLGFRQTEGINISNFNSKFERSFNVMFEDLINLFGREGYLTLSEESCRLTKKGLLLLDSIVDSFVAVI